MVPLRVEQEEQPLQHGQVKMGPMEQLVQQEIQEQQDQELRQAQLVELHLQHGQVKMLPQVRLVQRVTQALLVRLEPMALKALQVINQQ